MKNPFKKSIQLEPIPGSDYTKVLEAAKQIAKSTGRKITFGFNRRIGHPLVEVQPDGNVNNDYLKRVN